VLGVVLMALSVAGCGRRGRLEPPPDPSAPPESTVTKSGVHKRPRNPPITPPNEPFILDPLL
jgi:predicted small lipoprotein YifL